MDDRIAESIAAGRLQPRVGYSTSVTVKHVEPMPRRTSSTRKSKAEGDQAAAEAAYPAGFQPKEKACRREGCPKMFMPSAPAAAYCSTECRDEAIRAQRRETDRTKRQREREHEEAERGRPFTRVCRLEGCDVEFEPEHFNSRYCSSEHRAEATRIIKARNRAKREGREPPKMPTSATRQALAHIEAAAAATGDQPVPTVEAAEYLTYLWKRVEEDPDCPPHIYDRLERLLGLTPASSTINR